MNPTIIIAIGGIIILIGTAISIYGAYYQGIESSEQANRIEETLGRETTKLSYPLPSELFCTDLIILIKPEGLNKYLPELREKFKTDSLLAEHKGKGEYLNVNFPLINNEINQNLLSVFDGQTINITCQIGDENGPFINQNRKLIWELKTEISLTNSETHFLYFVDYENEPSEFFRLSMGNSKKIIQNSKLRLFSGISSAIELCGQRVYISFQIGNNQTLLPPIIEFKDLAFTDNNSREYYIEFDEPITVRKNRSKINEQIKKVIPEQNLPAYIEFTYLTGRIKCGSF